MARALGVTGWGVSSARVVVKSWRVDHRAAVRQPMLAINSALFAPRAVAGRWDAPLLQRAVQGLAHRRDVLLNSGYERHGCRGSEPGSDHRARAIGSMVRQMGGTAGTLRSPMRQAGAVAGRREIAALADAERFRQLEPMNADPGRSQNFGATPPASLSRGGSALPEVMITVIAARRAGEGRVERVCTRSPIVQSPRSECTDRRVVRRRRTHGLKPLRSGAAGTARLGTRPPVGLESQGPAKAAAWHGTPHAAGRDKQRPSGRMPLSSLWIASDRKSRWLGRPQSGAVQDLGGAGNDGSGRGCLDVLRPHAACGGGRSRKPIRAVDRSPWLDVDLA